jgi:dTDP-4-dehydrorhamnose reductase
MEPRNERPLEIWGGVECTINRVNDRYSSQLARNGHRLRLDDIDRFAELGLRALRFPILWEELAPDSLDQFIDWRSIDAQLERMRQLGIRPIAGLLHHGSGPRYTELLDPHFPAKLASFARRVAERYPWIEAYTPVNEPLTTARFSCLYGHWYPHACDYRLFGEALLNQCRGVVLAMRAIRKINPAAQLVQTDDLGKIHSTPQLRYQADYENARRWITWDLLCGSVAAEQPVWQHFVGVGVSPERLQIFKDEPCPPDVIGVNYYITGERYLDDRLHLHPPHTWGGNDREAYADRAAARRRPEGVDGPEKLLREACERYRRPVAVTEAHLGCTREEQLRWLSEVWEAACTLRAEGHDLRAVTAWSLLGAFDWNSLLTRDDDHYEPGVFDLRGGSPRATALARMLRSLAAGERFEHSALSAPGWWRRSVRVLEPVLVVETGSAGREECPPQVLNAATEASWRAPVRPVLITGAAGRLGRAFADALTFRALAHVGYTRAQLDITDAAGVRKALGSMNPWAVINCAGFAAVDGAESKKRECFRANVTGAETLADACAEAGIPLLTFSSDFVFDGLKDGAYVERDATSPLNFYGESKAAAEAKVLAACPRALVVRLGKLLVPHDNNDPLFRQVTALARGEEVRAPNDLCFSVTYLPDLLTTALDLLIDEASGVWHIANSGAITPDQLLIAAADRLQLDTRLVRGVPQWGSSRRALRPRNRALHSERAQFLSASSTALDRWAGEIPAVVTEPIASAVA